MGDGESHRLSQGFQFEVVAHGTGQSFCSVSRTGKTTQPMDFVRAALLLVADTTLGSSLHPTALARCLSV